MREVPGLRPRVGQEREAVTAPLGNIQAAVRLVHERLIVLSKGMLEGHGSLVTSVFAVQAKPPDHVLEVIGLRPESRIEKNAMAHLLAQSMRQRPAVDGLVVIGDAWVSARLDLWDAPPDEDPGRREALLVLLMAKASDWTEAWQYPYARGDDGSIAWEPPEGPLIKSARTDVALGAFGAFWRITGH